LPTAAAKLPAADPTHVFHRGVVAILPVAFLIEIKARLGYRKVLEQGTLIDGDAGMFSTVDLLVKIASSFCKK
jgi:hypothetical protein